MMPFRSALAAPILLALCCAALPRNAQAQAPEPTRLRYATYAGGFNVLNMNIDFTLTPQAYRVHIVLRTAGTLSAVMSGETETTVQGRFLANRPQPVQFFTSGHMRGRQRLTHIEYPAGQPDVRQLIPSNDDDTREVVSPEQQRGTVDTVSAMAELLHRVATTGKCDGRISTFDGRRLAELTAQTTGQEVLEPSSRSSFSGPALRCDFRGQMLAGFKTDEDRAKQAKPQLGTAWFAPATPGGPIVPVRVTFSTPFFGSATMYVTGPS